MPFQTGHYAKSDGLTIHVIAASQLIVFDGHTLPWISSSSASFSIKWPLWGTATFVLQSDGTLIENGSFVWKPLGAIPEKSSATSTAAATATTSAAANATSAAVTVRPRALPTSEQLRSFQEMGALLFHDVFSDIPECDAIASARNCEGVKRALKECASSGKSWFSTASDDPAFLALAFPIWPTICKVLGVPLSALMIPPLVQIAICMPREGLTPQAPGMLGSDAHIDGLAVAGSGVPAGEIRNHTLLLGVSLSDQREPNKGNLCIVPGSHTALGRAATRVGMPKARDLLVGPPEALPFARLDALLREGGCSGGLRGLAPPVPLCMSSGAACLLHFGTVHFVQPNCGGEPRIMIYWRILSPLRPGLARERFEAISNPFIEFPGLTP